MDAVPMVALGLIITEFFKGAYRILDHRLAWDDGWTLAACAVFLAKQTPDIILYYKQFDKYQTQFADKNAGHQVRRMMVENFSEILVLFFTYGAVQAIGVHNLSDKMFVENWRLTRAVGSDLLLAIACAELSWLPWEIVYIEKLYAAVRFANPDVPSRGLWAEVLAKLLSKDCHVLTWVGLNVSFFLVFLMAWCHIHYLHFWPSTGLNPTIPDAGVALRWFFLPVVGYFAVHHYFLRDYYFGYLADEGGSPAPEWPV